MLEIEKNFTTEENFWEFSTLDDFNSTISNFTEISQDAIPNATPNIPYTVMEILVAIVAVIGNFYDKINLVFSDSSLRIYLPFLLPGCS